MSRQTVSNVLNSPGIVREATRARVAEAIAELGYRPHASARRLRTRRASTIAVRLDPFAGGISGAVLDRFLHALTERAEARGLTVMLYTATDADDEIRQFQRLVDGAVVDAFVLASTYYGDPRTEWLIERGQPFVTFGRPWGIADLADPLHFWVDVDGRAGVAEAVRRLEADGCRRVGFLGWPAGSGSGDERRAGWAEAVTAAGVDAASRAALTVESEESVGAARAATRRLLEQASDLDAVIAASDTLALGALIETRGSLRVVGFDNTPIAAAIGFSSIDQRVDEVASAALELLDLVGRSEADDPRSHRLIVPDVIMREPGLALGLVG
ncbi:LacI family DNA-binding transcriptional regulator [Gryllotalpicola protaetiae]|uniref:LacI family DNA-binding transcriptional regulator n=1 Tax=Gryllotalpicola protaetiae TaxID=2419771 RepID=UPI001FEAE82D|nr:substrate-binding domain-containing protein [Gryllotalpicola protaetiae]